MMKDAQRMIAERKRALESLKGKSAPVAAAPPVPKPPVGIPATDEKAKRIAELQVSFIHHIF